MAAIYRLVVTFLVTSTVTFGYRRVPGSRHPLNDRTIRNGDFRGLDAAYEYFTKSVIKKPVLTEVHYLPPVYLVEEDSPLSARSSTIFPTTDNDKRLGTQKTYSDTVKPKVKRPLVQLFSKKDSEIGKAIDKFLKAAEAKHETKLKPVPKTSPVIEAANTIADNQEAQLKEAFPVPMTKVLDMQTLVPSGPGPYGKCFPPSVVVCGARLPWAHVHGMKDWCEKNCDKEAYRKHCDDIRCTCKCLAP